MEKNYVWRCKETLPLESLYHMLYSLIRDKYNKMEAKCFIAVISYGFFCCFRVFFKNIKIICGSYQKVNLNRFCNSLNSVQFNDMSALLLWNQVIGKLSLPTLWREMLWLARERPCLKVIGSFATLNEVSNNPQKRSGQRIISVQNWLLCYLTANILRRKIYEVHEADVSWADIVGALVMWE